MEITKETFARFLKVQQSGMINMTDIVTGAKLARITEQEYEYILWNYSELRDKFYPKRKK
jgi:hypothetical protein